MRSPTRKREREGLRDFWDTPIFGVGEVRTNQRRRLRRSRAYKGFLTDKRRKHLRKGRPTDMTNAADEQVRERLKTGHDI